MNTDISLFRFFLLSLFHVLLLVILVIIIIIVKNPKDRILLILDVLDGCPSNAFKQVTKLIKRRLLSKCSLVVTSMQEKTLEVRRYFDS